MDVKEPSEKRDQLGKQRTIRFKEWGVFTDRHITPKPEYLAVSDGSLKAEPFRLRTDAEGFILGGNDIPDPGSLRKIVMLGGSFVESLFEHEQQRFASILERQLNADGYPYQCWNAGYSGATLLHSFNVFMNKVIPQTAYIERVLIFTAMSDQRTLGRTRSYWARDKTHAPIIEDRNGSVPSDRPASTEQQEMLLRTFVDAARNFGQEPVIVCSPFRDGAYAVDPYMARIHGSAQVYNSAQEQMQMINRAARAVAKAEGVEVIDAESALHGQFGLFYDTMHLNTSGHEAMAEVLLHALSAMLPAPSRPEILAGT